MRKKMNFTIESWSPLHPRWTDYIDYLRTAGLSYVLEGILEQDLLDDSRFLAALEQEKLVGILMFLTQPIGPEMDVPPIRGRFGQALIEAKVRTFHVLKDYRNQGIGTALQRKMIDLARIHGCYQVRSRSELEKAANYAIKLKLGFGMHPAIRVLGDGTQSPGVYWIKGLKE